MTTSIYTNNYRSNLTKFWQQYYPNWNIPEGYHVHHIKPKSTFSDPNDLRIHHPKNLIALHPDDHQSIHKCRGDKQVSNGFLSIKDINISIKTRNKMSKVKLGRKLSDYTKAKMSNAKQGKKCSLEMKAKMSKIQKGKNNSTFSGYYIFNETRYTTLDLMIKEVNGTLKSLARACKSDNNKIITPKIYCQSIMLTSLGSKEQIVGKTFKELGFGFEAISK